MDNYSSKLALLARAQLALAMTYARSAPSPQKKRVGVKEIVLDEERFGKAPESLRKPLLAGRRGKLSKAKRKRQNQS